MSDQPVMHRASFEFHFAEWLTKKHTFTLIALYEQFEEQEYKHQPK